MMDPFDALQLWQLLEHIGLPAVLALPTVIFLISYARSEKRKADDSECPPWLIAAKRSIIERMEIRLNQLETSLKKELRDHEQDYKARDLRQQRIENMLSELRGYFRGGQH